MIMNRDSNIFSQCVEEIIFIDVNQSDKNDIDVSTGPWEKEIYTSTVTKLCNWSVRHSLLLQ